MYNLVIFSGNVFNIFATYTLGKRDVNTFENKRKDSELQLYIGSPFQCVQHHPKMQDFPTQVTRGVMCYSRAEAVCPFNKHVFLPGSKYVPYLYLSLHFRWELENWRDKCNETAAVNYSF